MNTTMKKTMYVLVGLVLVGMLSGCTNWEKKYRSLNVLHQNLQGRYENCVSSLDVSATEKAELGSVISAKSKTIEELERLAEQRNISVGEASGFGDEMDVVFDADAGTITVTLANSILFAPGSAKFKAATSAELNHIVSVLKSKYKGKEVDVVGHTDADPIKKSKKYWKDNWDLSAGRALTVLRYVQKKGIKKNKIRAVAAGSSRPVASNKTVSGKAKNRRVEIVVHVQ